MKIIKAHYEKFIFATSLFLLGTFFVIEFIFDEDGDSRKNPFGGNDFFEIQASGSEVELSFLSETELMPGNLIFVTLDSGESAQVRIEGALFKRRSDILVYTDDGNKIDGRVSSNQNLILESDWKTQRGALNVETKTGVLPVPYESVQKVAGRGVYTLEATAASLDWDSATLSVYQPKIYGGMESNQTARVRWQKKSEDMNESIYDTFTPPVIYLIDGRLTTKLPEEPVAEAEKEPFGLLLTDFSQRPYPHMLKRWIGETPYFEDLNTPMAPNSDRNVFNRLEVGKTYRPNTERKPGQPSLIECEKTHPDAKISIEYFIAQQLPTKSGGRMLVGRAMVKDHKMDGKPFEINSLMKEVFAGDYKIKLLFNLAGLEPKEFEFSQDDVSTTFEHESRKYKIENIDLENKSLLISKEATIMQPSEKIILSLPPVDPLR